MKRWKEGRIVVRIMKGVLLDLCAHLGAPNGWKHENQPQRVAVAAPDEFHGNGRVKKDGVHPFHTLFGAREKHNITTLSGNQSGSENSHKVLHTAAGFVFFRVLFFSILKNWYVPQHKGGGVQINQTGCWHRVPGCTRSPLRQKCHHVLHCPLPHLKG